MRLDHIFPGVVELRPDDVQRYLRGRGWRPIDDPRATVAAYASARGDEVVVPLDRTLGDYARRLGELVDTVSRSEGRAPGEVLEELSLPPGDALSFRVRSDLVSSGTIPVLDSLRLREGQKNLLLAAAHSALVPQRYFPRLGRAEPTELLAQCREGQTARGSYVTTLLVPVAPAVGELAQEEPTDAASRASSWRRCGRFSSASRARTTRAFWSTRRPGSPSTCSRRSLT